MLRAARLGGKVGGLCGLIGSYKRCIVDSLEDKQSSLQSFPFSPLSSRLSVPLSPRRVLEFSAQRSGTLRPRELRVAPPALVRAAVGSFRYCIGPRDRLIPRPPGLSRSTPPPAPHCSAFDRRVLRIAVGQRIILVANVGRSEFKSISPLHLPC
jgi:hypothetical protein